MSDRDGGIGGGMPAEPWMFACGFRTIIGKLLDLSIPQAVCNANQPSIDLLPVSTSQEIERRDNSQNVLNNPNDNPLGSIVNGQIFLNGNCTVLICEGAVVNFTVDIHSAIIGLSPTGMDPNMQPLYHIGELVQVNLRARSNNALSIERYFSNVRHMPSARE